MAYVGEVKNALFVSWQPSMVRCQQNKNICLSKYHFKVIMDGIGISLFLNTRPHMH